MKKGQITVFIIIGLILLFVIGTVLYTTRIRVTKEIEAVRPRVAEIPQQIQPLRDFVEACIKRVATDGLRKIGDQGGYIKPLPFVAGNPTEGEAVQFSPGADPITAYWWYMKDKNDCEQNCQFDSKRPLLYRAQGGNSIEKQLDDYITANLRDCLGDFEAYRQTGCIVEETGSPAITTNIAEDDVFFVGKYQLRATCEGQTFTLEDYYVPIPLNLKEIYTLATNITTLETQHRIFEAATLNLIDVYSGLDSDRLPPIRDLEVGPPGPGTYWIKHDVLNLIKQLLMSNIPIIQASDTRNYKYIQAPPGTRDPELYEVIYNRQFFIPLFAYHPDLEVKFNYFDWWQPYFELNCNGQLCQADSASNFYVLPFTINRYTFSYDLSYPILVEIRNPDAFAGQGYSFKFFIEQNMRNSEAFLAEAPLIEALQVPGYPSIFCDPDQRTSGEVSIYVRDGKTLQGQDQASISYICGTENCNLGMTRNGEYASKFPRCIGGTLRLTKPGYASISLPMDTHIPEPINLSLIMEPVTRLQATAKNYAITKQSKYSNWQYFGGGPLRAKDTQSTIILLTRNSTEYEEPYTSVVEITGDEPSTLNIIPGTYKISITSFLKDNLTIPPDQRCFKVPKLFKKEKKCFFVPQEPIRFNETSPFPYGSEEYEYTFAPDMLRTATQIEFKQFILAIDRVPENQRIAEDLSEATKVSLYAAANNELLYPVIK